MSILINNPGKCTKLEIWSPRYSSKYGDEKEWCALLAKYKVDQASPTIIIEFTRSKHLECQRFAIYKRDVLKCKIDDNGKIPCYVVKMSDFKSWETGQEIMDVVNEIF